jgi:hypothetical protein
MIMGLLADISGGTLAVSQNEISKTVISTVADNKMDRAAICVNRTPDRLTTSFGETCQKNVLPALE